MTSRLSHLPLAAAAAMFLMPASAAGQQRGDVPAPPEAFTRAVQCRTVADPQERLACYDREVAALAAAEAARDIRVVDRQQVRQTRRSLFGLILPDLNVFGSDDRDQEAVNEINATIASVSRDPYGKWSFVLDDGVRWSQTDSRELPIDPRPGQPIRIRRAAMGSFLANVNRQVAIRVRRQH